MAKKLSIFKDEGFFVNLNFTRLIFIKPVKKVATNVNSLILLLPWCLNPEVVILLHLSMLQFCCFMMVSIISNPPQALSL
jgi:hypothetical protein